MGFLEKTYCQSAQTFCTFLRFQKTPYVGLKLNYPAVTSRKRIWFHAASVGELEALWPIVLMASESNVELVISIFSSSALQALQKLKSEINHDHLLIDIGYSPREGYWKKALTMLLPHLFITVKYEAWPELWLGLKDLNIPLIVIGASVRPSLLIARYLCLFLSNKLPKTVFLASENQDFFSLKKAFPESKVIETGDPRWDRVRERVRKENLRVQHLIECYKNFPRPWGVLGGVWMSDLKFWDGVLKEVRGTLWVVPHRPDLSNILKFENFFNSVRLPYIKSSLNQVSETKKVILVDELGFLLELYRFADWAFVGGGWERGVHNTMEPAVHGIPIGVGPKATKKFSEIVALKKSGQIEVVYSKNDLKKWVKKLFNPGETSKKDFWLKEIQSKFGAKDRVWSFIGQELKNE